MSDRITRRQFAGTAASAATITAAATLIVAKGESLSAAQKAADSPAKADDSKSTLELITQIAQQEFPHEKLDATAIEEIRSDVRSNLSRAQQLSSFPLSNSNEPGFIFAAWRNDLNDVR